MLIPRFFQARVHEKGKDSVFFFFKKERRDSVLMCLRVNWWLASVMDVDQQHLHTVDLFFSF